MSSRIPWNLRNSSAELHICNCSNLFHNLRITGPCELMRPAQDSRRGGTGRARQSEIRRTARHKQGQTTDTICGPSHAEPLNLDNLSFGDRSVVRLADPSFLKHFLSFLKKTQQNTKSAREFSALTELGRITVFSSYEFAWILSFFKEKTQNNIEQTIDENSGSAPIQWAHWIRTLELWFGDFLMKLDNWCAECSVPSFFVSLGILEWF